MPDSDGCASATPLVQRHAGIRPHHRRFARTKPLAHGLDSVKWPAANYCNRGAGSLCVGLMFNASPSMARLDESTTSMVRSRARATGMGIAQDG